MRRQPVLISALVATLLAGCSLPGVPGAAAPSSAAATTVAQAPAPTATVSAAPTPSPATVTPSAATPTAAATVTATPSSSARSKLPPNLGAKGRSPRPSTAPPTQPTPKPPTAPPAQPTPTPPASQAPAPPTATPTEVVINFLRSVQQALNTPGNTQYLSSTLAQRVANGETVGSLLNVGDDPTNLYIDFSVGDFSLGSSGVAAVDATLTYNNAVVNRMFLLVDEGDGWRIDNITDTTPPEPPLNPDPSPANPPTPTSPPAANVVQPVDVVQAYVDSLIADPSGASSGQYLSPDVPSLGLDAFIGDGALINYVGVPLDDGSGSTAAVQYTFSTDQDDFVYTFGLERAGQVWFISAIN